VSALLARGLRTRCARGRSRARLRLRLSAQPRLAGTGSMLARIAAGRHGVPVRILTIVSSSFISVQHAPPRQSPCRNQAGHAL